MRATQLIAAMALLAGMSAAQAGGDAAHGEKLFADCAACHALDRSAEGVGPSLYGVFNRKAGELADYRYSPALRRSGITWSVQTLDTFIADPQAAVPANRMPYAGMSNAGDRTDLIAYLQKAFR